MSSKGDVYIIRVPANVGNDSGLPEVVFNVNRVLRQIEDRLDEMEAIRGSQYFTTTRWEKDYVL